MSSQRAFKCSIEMHYMQDACVSASLCCWVFSAHPRDGVEGLWVDVVARLVSSPCFLKFLFIGNMSEWVRLCEKSWKPCRVQGRAPGCGSCEVCPSLRVCSGPGMLLRWRLREKSTLPATGGDAEKRTTSVLHETKISSPEIENY